MKRLVVGILAHVDSGKTTLSEGLLYISGNIKKLGRVDHGDAFLDSYALERRRGITIFSKQAVLQLGDTIITLLDTPGHVDFSPEMERTLDVLDYAILLISGTDGVQSHTETLWRLLRRHSIPTFLFINKMDLPGADRERIMGELKQRLSGGCTDFGAVSFMDSVAMCDEGLLSQFLETGILPASAVKSAVAQCKIFPCFFGAALKLDGVDALLSALELYTDAPTCPTAFGGKVFKISRDEQGNRLTYMKITGGSFKVRDSLCGCTRDNEAWSQKVNQIRIYSGAKFQTAEQALPGMICAVTGLDYTYQGEGLGTEPESDTPFFEPVLTYSVILPSGIDALSAIKQLRLLEEEEPQLHIVLHSRTQEIHMQLMGEVQLEVLKSLISERFNLDVSFGQGSIVYKETIASAVEGVGHFEPLRHYAEVHLLMQPGERGSGLCFDTACSEDVLDKNWQRLILTHLGEKPHVGVLTGSPITDMKITLISGRGHIKHTEGGDFRQATYRAVRQGLMQAKSILLEPWYSFHLEVPTENVGRAMSDLQRMNGCIEPPETSADLSVLTGKAPVSAIGGYQMEVTNYTRGRGRLLCSPAGYEPCHNQDEVVAAFNYDRDGDIENTADSVFCSHGAGYTVKWDDVPSHMHIESGLKLDLPEEQSAPQATMRRAQAYCATVAQDKELMEIFERTYGPIRRDLRTSFNSVRKPVKPAVTYAQNTTIGTEYLLVDGYNIIFAWEDLSALAKQNLDAARNKLINILRNYQGFRKCELILVFDAYKVKGNKGEVENLHNISVVYTKEAETADMYIEKVTHELGKTRRVRVATSDGLEQLIILSHGAQRISALAFRKEVDEIEQAIRGFLEKR